MCKVALHPLYADKHKCGYDNCPVCREPVSQYVNHIKKEHPDWWKQKQSSQEQTERWKKAERVSKKVKCEGCDGTGQVPLHKRPLNKRYVWNYPCSKCNGTGYC